MEGLNTLGKVDPDRIHNLWLQGHFPLQSLLYLQVRTECDQPLSPTLFTKEVVSGMMTMQGQLLTTQPEALLISDCEAVIEFERDTNMDRVIACISPLQYWLGQKVHLVCRLATPEDLERARRHEEEAGRAYSR